MSSNVLPMNSRLQALRWESHFASNVADRAWATQEIVGASLEGEVGEDAAPKPVVSMSPEEARKWEDNFTELLRKTRKERDDTFRTS